MEVTGTWVLRSQPTKYILACELGKTAFICFCVKAFHNAGHEEHLCSWRSKAGYEDFLHPLGQPSTGTECLENLSVSILGSFQHPAGLSFE